MDVVRRRTERACLDEKAHLLQHVFTPLSLALKQFKVIDNDGFLHQVSLAWEEFHGMLTSAVSQLESSSVQFPSKITVSHHADSLNTQYVADYEAAIDQMIVNEKALRQIDQLILDLDQVICQKNYATGLPSEREKYDACAKLINTYQDKRYLLIVGQESEFQLFIGKENDILKPLRQHKSRVGQLFSSHTPSIVERVTEILSAFSQIGHVSKSGLQLSNT